ncbi:DUF2291 domain-containing protein [Niabella ginsengisoli]|uniref:DUF2291 domain-containing protein n=1 Tax=Niabella ginsengisoli TaxID=522298 RepID=A0ABS9SHL2_9BACT|nr:DUF2291 domain-containing protein [Niabella ginsengisoli]MCH5597801.1 DUF2291 domain-containing protein [Niabella ginsengisoli]
MQASKGEKFDAAAYVRSIWNDQLQKKLDSAIDISILRQSLQSGSDKAFDENTHALAIGNYRYALVKGIAVVDKVNQDDVTILIESQPNFKATLATEFVYGNALRDASGLIDLKAFPNTNDLNAVSEELNRMVRNKVVPSIKPLLKVGSKIEFTGAIELNKEHVRFDNIEIIPVRIKTVS